jgi:hypothetical protein
MVVQVKNIKPYYKLKYKKINFIFKSISSLFSPATPPKGRGKKKRPSHILNSKKKWLPGLF